MAVKKLGKWRNWESAETGKGRLRIN